MKAKYYLLFLLVTQLTGCSHEGDEPSAPAREKSAESRVKHGTNGEIVLTLDAETQKAMGLEVTALSQAELPHSIKSYGRVLDGGQIATQFSELAAAVASSEASQKELQRLKTLAAQNNTSQRALQAADATATRDQAQAQAARLRLIGAWGNTLANRPDLPALVESLASLSNALVQLNIPGSQALASSPSGARVMAALATNAVPIEAQFAGSPPMIDPQLQGQGFLFLVSPNSSKLIPGAAVTGYITLPGEPQGGVLLPRNAIVRFNGTTWVYQQTSEKTFARVEVSLVEPLADGWFVGPGLKPQDKVVSTGAQLLLSEELKGQTEE